MNYREKIISDNIAFCLRFRIHLTDWEEKFIGSVNSQSYPLTQKQFNILQDVALSVSKRVA